MTETSLPLAIQLFGPLQVQVFGADLPHVRTRSVQWLLALLTLRAGGPVSRSWLAGTLWPESREEQALLNLRSDLVRLRTALGGEAARIVAPDRRSLRLDLTGAFADVAAFDAAIRAGDEGSLRTAVELYRGPLLEGCYAEWALVERNVRAEQALAALETLAERAQERGGKGEAIRFLRRAEAFDPLRDSVVRRLMACLSAAGDPAAAIEVYRAFRLRLQEELAAAPDAATARLFHEIRAAARSTAHGTRPSPETRPSFETGGDAPRAVPSPMAPVPRPLTSLIGREQEVSEVQRLLEGNRLVTLAGAGGVGKTRLALEVAREVAAQGGISAAFVSLASLSEPALLPGFVAGVLGLREEATSATTSLLQALLTRLSIHPLLLILDNCEHLHDAVADLTQVLLEGCPDLRILATSRQRLGLSGETVWRVPSLPTPDPQRLPSDGEDATEFVRGFPAVRLFEERAGTVRPGFRLEGPEAAFAAARICHRLDGVPLAIELAAARTRTLTVGQIAARLDDRFGLLIGGSREGLTRHQTLRALIDWSYELLNEEERTLLSHLSVFVGGWTLAAAAAVAGAERSSMSWPEGLAMPDLLASLADKSLVLVEEEGDGLRYRMPETIRDYGLEKLAERGELRLLRSRHAEHFLTLAQAARPGLEHADPKWLDRLEIEHGNLRVALEGCFSEEGEEETGLCLAAALRYFWELRGYVNERWVWLEGTAIRTSGRTEARARVLNGAGNLAREVGDASRARARFEESLSILREGGHRQGIAETLNNLGLIAEGIGEGEEARRLYEESLAIMRELEDRQGIAHSLFNLGSLAHLRGDTTEARALWEECRALDEALGVRGGYVLLGLGEIALGEGDSSEAFRLLSTFLIERREVGDRLAVARSLEGLARVAALEARLERALRLLGAAKALRERIKGVLLPNERQQYEETLRSLQETLDEADYSFAWEAGVSLGYEEAINFALEREVPVLPSLRPFRLRPATPPQPLTPLIGREAEVREVVERLAVSRLVTLVGGGGVGKTRLAIEVAARAVEAFPGGVVWVELASLGDGALILPAIATVLGLGGDRGEGREELEARVVARLYDGIHLLVLDNCEHLREAASQTAHALLLRSPSLRVLATSRQRLSIPGELVWPTPPLAAPDSETAIQDIEGLLRAYPSLQLLAERVAQVRPGFQLTEREEVVSAARICHRLDGIPLALELAAARAHALSLSQIAARLDDRFRLLTGGSRAALPRQQTLQALIDWSHDLLSEPERVLLRRLAVFLGGWTLEAAEAVYEGRNEGGGMEPVESHPSALDVLASLVDKSLVLAEEQPGSLRYRMLETIREYASEKLRESGEEEAVRERHADYYLALAEQAHPFLATPEPAWLDRLEVEHDNLRAALTFYSAREERIGKAVRLTAEVGPFWNFRGYFHEQRIWLSQLALRPTPPTIARARLLGSAAHVAASDRDFASANRMCIERLQIERQLGDPKGIASALNGLAWVIVNSELAGLDWDPVAARSLAEESLVMMQEVGDRQEMAHALFLLGHLARQSGDNDEARTRWLECRALDQALGIKGGLVLSKLGELALATGDYAVARQCFETFLIERHKIGEHWGVLWSLQGLGTLASAQGEPKRAARLLGASLAVRESLPSPLSEADRAGYKAKRDALRQALDEAALCAAWEEGYAMTLEQAVASALTPA